MAPGTRWPVSGWYGAGPRQKKTGSALSRSGLSGGGEIRTPVRLPIPRDIYVRSPLFLFPRPVIGQRTALPEPVVKVSPVASRRRPQASPILMAPIGPPRTGLTNKREVRNRKRFYLRSQSEVIVRRYKIFQRILEVSGTSARNHGFTAHVETMTPPTQTSAIRRSRRANKLAGFESIVKAGSERAPRARAARGAVAVQDRGAETETRLRPERLEL